MKDAIPDVADVMGERAGNQQGFLPTCGTGSLNLWPDFRDLLLHPQLTTSFGHP